MRSVLVQEVHRLKKKLRQRETIDGDWVMMLANKQSNHRQELLQWKVRVGQADLSPPTIGSPPLSPGGPPLGLTGIFTAEEARLKELLKKSQKEHELKEFELVRGRERAEKEKEKAEKDLQLFKKKEKEERRSYLEKINKLKKERDEFAAEHAALQVASHTHQHK